MKTAVTKFLFFILISIMALTSDAQNGNNCTISHNNKKVLTVTKEDLVKNKIVIKAAELKKTGSLVIAFPVSKAKPEWKRNLMIYDTADNVLLTKENITGLTLSNTELTTLLAGKKKFSIFTTSIPTDPKKAAAIRVRRVHVCTVEIK
jgi:hypothetical protein